MGAKIQSLDVWNKTFIITTGNIDQNSVSTYLKQKFREREFTKGSIFKTYAGAHGYRDGRLGDRESGIKQLRSDINCQLRDDVEDAREDDLLQDKNREALHERLSECTETIMENVASKDLYGHIRSAIIELRQDEEMLDIIEEMGYNLLNPDLIGKDKRDFYILTGVCVSECVRQPQILLEMDIRRERLYGPYYGAKIYVQRQMKIKALVISCSYLN